MSTDPFPLGALIADKVTGAYLGIVVDGKDAVPVAGPHETVAYNPHRPRSAAYMTHPTECLTPVGASTLDRMREIQTSGLHEGDLVQAGGELRVVRQKHWKLGASSAFLVLSGGPHPDHPVPPSFPPDALWGYRVTYLAGLPVTAYCPDRH